MRFAEVDIKSAFFDSLKRDYLEFADWFRTKGKEQAYVMQDEATLLGFMYLKLESGPVTDVEPQMPAARRLKVGTLKIDAHGSRLGQRFIKKALDHAISEGVTELYITVFPKHFTLIALLQEFGFTQYGAKTSANGTEVVLVKSLSSLTGSPRLDYPRFRILGNRKFILPIQPKWHTQLFPDSILASESYDVVADVAHTNSIDKCYICFMDASEVSPGDLLVIYRTSDSRGPAEYRSVVTSICTAEDIRFKRSFVSRDEFLEYSEKASVFDRGELLSMWDAVRQQEMVVVRMLYNAALTKRLIRKTLVEDVGVARDAYPGFLELTDQQLEAILKLGGVDASLVVN
ncbi:MAG: GNAT family N-acetyltransferase [Thermotogota bacterium]